MILSYAANCDLYEHIRESDSIFVFWQLSRKFSFTDKIYKTKLLNKNWNEINECKISTKAFRLLLNNLLAMGWYRVFCFSTFFTLEIAMTSISVVFSLQQSSSPPFGVTVQQKIFWVAKWCLSVWWKPEPFVFTVREPTMTLPTLPPVPVPHTCRYPLPYTTLRLTHSPSLISTLYLLYTILSSPSSLVSSLYPHNPSPSPVCTNITLTHLPPLVSIVPCRLFTLF